MSKPSSKSSTGTKAKPLITVTVNSQQRQAQDGVTLPAFLESLGVQTRFMAVAYNGEVLRKEEHPTIVLKDGDVLELVRPVGGG